MIRHVVLMTFKPDIPAREIEEIAESLRALGDQIPAVSEYEVGLGMFEGNATMAVVGLFADEAAFQDYRENAAHRALAEDVLIPAVISSANAQYEC